MTKKKALFLDRDGVINYDIGYLSRIEKIRFIDGIFDLCRAAVKLDYLIIVITNQSGIGRGYYSEEDFFMLMEWICKRFEAEHVSISDVFYCPFHPVYGIGDYKRDSFDRKPNPGMLLRAAKKHNIDLRNSIMIGDNDSDMEAARRAGVGIRCHYLFSDRIVNKSTSATHLVYSLFDAIPLLGKR